MEGEVCWLVGAHGAYLAVDGDGRLCMSEEKDASSRWTVKPTGGGDGCHHLTASTGHYLSVAGRGEQSFSLARSPERGSSWTLVEADGEEGRCLLLSFYGTFLASLNDEAQTLYMSPNKGEWETWRRIPCSQPQGIASGGQEAPEGSPLADAAGAGTGEPGTTTPGEEPEGFAEAAGLAARHDAGALEALLSAAAAGGRLPALLAAADGDGNGLLHKCCVGAPSAGAEDAAQVAELLVRRGASANAANVLGETPLLAAIRASAPLALVRRLLELRADPDHADGLTGDTALMEAACMGDAAECAALLQAKADPSLQNFHGLTALDIAAAAGHEPSLLLPGAAPASPEDEEPEATEAAGGEAKAAELQERCQQHGVPLELLGELGAEEVLHEVLRLQTLRSDELRREGQALNLRTEHCYQQGELLGRCRQYYIWQALPLDSLASECQARASHVLTPARGGGAPRSREELVEALVVATWGGATKNQKLSDGRAKGIPVDRLESPDQAAQLMEELEKLAKGSLNTLKQECMKRGFATPGGASKEELLALLRDVLLWELLPLPDLRQICRRRGLKVNQRDLPRPGYLELLAHASWEERGIPRHRVTSPVVAQGILSSVEGFEARAVEDLEAMCRKRGLPVEPRPEKQILIGRLRDALVWEHMPMDELVRECEKQGVPTEEKLCAGSGGVHPDAKAPSGLRHGAFAPSPFRHVHLSSHREQELLVGRWQYGSKPTEYAVRAGEDGHLHFEGPHSRTGTVSGSLRLHGEWWQCQLTSSEGESVVGSIRLRYVKEDDQVVSNFKSLGREDWGKDLVASRPKANPAEQEPRRLLGRWTYGSKLSEYRVGATADGKLSFTGPHSRAGLLRGVLEKQGEWMQAGLAAQDGEVVGAIRLRFVEEDGTTVSNFKSATMEEWGKDIIAKKAEDGLGGPAGARRGTCADRKTLVERLAKAAEERMKSARGVAWERFDSKETGDEVFKMVLELEQMPDEALRREYERLNLPPIAQLTWQQVLEAVRSWYVWGKLPLEELEKERRAAERAGDLLPGAAAPSPGAGRAPGPLGSEGVARRMPPAARSAMPGAQPLGGPRAAAGGRGLGARQPAASWARGGAAPGRAVPMAPAGAAAAGGYPGQVRSSPSEEDRRLDPHDNVVRSLREMVEHYKGDFSEAEVRQYFATCQRAEDGGRAAGQEGRRDFLREQLLQALCVRIYEAKGVPARRLGEVAKARRVHERVWRLEKMTAEELWREVTQVFTPNRKETDRLVLLRRLKAATLWQELPQKELQAECKKAGIQMSPLASCQELVQRLIRRSWSADTGPKAAPKPKPAPRPQQRPRQPPPRPRTAADVGKMKKEFERLGLPTTANAAEIRKAYRRLALQYHPDKNPGQAQEAAAAKFREVQAAYEALCGCVKA